MTWKIEDINSDRNCLSKGDIKQYLQHSMTAQARFELENHLLDCALCNAAVEGYVDHPEEIRKAEGSSLGIRKWLSVAASIAVVLLVGVASVKYYRADQPSRTFAKFYEKPSWDYQTRGASASSVNIQAVDNFNNGRYQAAIPVFDSLLILNEEDNQMRLYKGIAHLELAQSEQAADALTTVRINSDIYFEEATWYLALLNIKINNNTEAIDYLDDLIMSSDGFYNTKAIEMKKWLQK